MQQQVYAQKHQQLQQMRMQQPPAPVSTTTTTTQQHPRQAAPQMLQQQVSIISCMTLLIKIMKASRLYFCTDEFTHFKVTSKDKAQMLEFKCFLWVWQGFGGDGRKGIKYLHGKQTWLCTYYRGAQIFIIFFVFHMWFWARELDSFCLRSGKFLFI